MSSHKSLVAFVLLLAALTRFGFAFGPEKPAFKVEITRADGRPLPANGGYAVAGIEQTLVARVVPPTDGVTVQWTIGPDAIRTYEHDIQDAAKHKPIPLSAADLKGNRVSFFWTRPVDGAMVSVEARKGNVTASAKVAFDVRLPRDANRLIYSFADNDPRRSPNGVSASYAITRDHRLWHIGQKMSTGNRPMFANLADAPAGSDSTDGKRYVWGDLGYRDDPARLFDVDYNGTALLGWHGAALDAHRAWRRTFHVPVFDAATPPGSLPIPGYLKRVPAADSADKSRLYGYVRVGEFQNMDQLGRDAVHPWHNRSHTGIAKTNLEPLMDNHGKSPPAKADLFWRWHSVVEEVRRALGPDKAAVTEIYPSDGSTAEGVSAIYLAFDRRVSVNAPATNKVQLRPALLTVNGQPATAVTDVGGDKARFIMFRFTGFPAPAAGPVKVELAGTPGIEKGAWTFTAKKGNAADDVPPAFRERAEKAYAAAQSRQRKADIDRLLALLKPADADDIWIGYLFRAYPMPASEGVPILLGLLDHPSDQIKGRAIQTLQLLYPRDSASAEAKLVKLLQDPDREWWVRERAAQALGEITTHPDEAVQVLLAGITKKAADEPLNVGCIESLGRLGPKSAAALPALRKLLSDEHPHIQKVAYLAIARIGKVPTPSPADLKSLKAIDFTGADSGFAVHQALQKMGAQGSFAVPALLKTLENNPPAFARAAVFETFGKVGGGAPAIKHLLAALPARFGEPGDSLQENFLSDRAVEALARIPTSDPEMVPLLADALADADPIVRYQAAKTLRRFGPAAKPAAPALVKAIERADGKSDPYEIGAYLSALRAIGPDAGKFSGDVAKFLDERSPLYRGQEPFWAHFLQAYILATLADIGTPEEAKPYVLNLLNNSDKTTAHGYAAAARALRPEWTEGLGGLQRALKSDFPDFPMTFEDFAMALGNEDASCRLEALRALARMGERAKAALPLVAQVAEERPDPASPSPPWNDEARRTLKAIRGEK